MLKKVILIGNGSFFLSKLFITLATKHVIIAVDGGANTCKKHNIIPSKIIGDLDSITEETRQYFSEKNVEIINISEQNSNDLEKAIKATKFCTFYCFGFTGKEIDHEISLLHILQKNFLGKYGNSRSGKRKKIIIFSETQAFFVLEKEGEIKLNNKKSPVYEKIKISFYPLSATKFIFSSGLKYKLDGLTLKQGKLIGTSNQLGETKEKIDWKIEKGCCLIFLPQKNLPKEYLN